MGEGVNLYTGFASGIDVHFAALNDLDSVPIPCRLPRAIRVRKK